jgi:predicted nucleic acid-binding protein
LEDAVFKEAGRLKAIYRISLADSLALAEAKTRGARIMTADHHEFDTLDKKGEVAFLWIR